jgi:DNA invertase Pin-like site-specific DNA recombinase
MSRADTPNAAVPPRPGAAACDPGQPWASPCHKVRRQHLERLAVVYVRQSTPQQIVNNCESTARQYALRDRATQLGWPAGRVEVIDDDQGQSGQSAEGRPGFQALLARIALGEVGIVLGLEMSRLARSNKDWHQLLEVCALFGTLLADADGVYDPTDHNDRLLLGLKGAMSEAELHTLRARLHQGLLNKARRGEVYNHPPIGYVKSPKGGFVLDPDEQVQAVVRLILEQLGRQGSASALLRYLVRNGIRVPVRPHGGEQRGELVWRRPNRVTLLSLLHHPIYAGFYRWGHRTTDPRRKKPGRRHSGRVSRRPEDCLVLLPGRCPAYISAELFRANQELLSANRAGAAGPGAPREGPALLGGLLLCGRCGYRLSVNYTDGGRNLRYCCCRARTSYGEPGCQSLSGRCLDELVAREVLAALRPAQLELQLRAADDIEQQRQRLHQDWRQRLERAAYQAERAARQYRLAEPENRLVVRALERLWEEALQGQARLQGEYERFRQAQPPRLSEGEKAQVRQLAQDVPALWGAATTTARDRQRLVRLLVQEVEVEVQGQTEQVAVAIHWSGGLVSRHRLARGVQRYEQLAAYRRLCARVDELRASGKSMGEVAECLNAEGFRPAKRVERFTGGMVSGLLARRCASGAGRHGQGAAGLMEKGEWLLGYLARHLGVPAVTLHRWRKGGWVSARKLDVAGGLWAVWATGPERRRMGRLRRFQKDHPNQPIPAELTTPRPPATH